MRARGPWWGGPVLLSTAMFASGACTAEHPPFAGHRQRPERDGSSDPVLEQPPNLPPPADAPGLCGNLIIPLIIERPNFYFVLDASGSMNEPMDTPSQDGFLPDRYAAARRAIRDMLRVLGHRVTYGAALFPAATAGEDCPPGEEVFTPRPGDAVSYAISGATGPVLDALLRTLSGRSPSGATPTAATLVALRERILSLPGKTFVFLLTDGAPNCNATLPCTAAMCTANIEGLCAPIINCCDPANQGDYRGCLDAEPTVAAVADLFSAGVSTFVVGMPGTEAYEALLDRVAEAGGTARAGSPRYYPSDGADDLAETLKTIGLAVAIECDVPLGEAPPDPTRLNVYFDQTVLPQSEEDGWTWAGSDIIRIVGPACDHLKAGDVLQLQVVAGCPTVVR